MLKIPISGGPNTGKTTLLSALQEVMPEAHFVEEPAEKVIAAELAKEQMDKTYKGIYPTENYPAFIQLAIDASVALEAAIPEDAALAIQDRGHIDNIGYYRLNGLTELLPEIERRATAANYAFAFFCEPVGVYTPTAIRRESPEQAARTHQFLADAYEQSGIPIIRVPAVSVPERVELVLATIDRFS